MRHAIRSSLLLGAVAFLAWPAIPNARAGSYVVNGTCGAWHPVNNAARGLAIYSACPTLTVRNVQGNQTTPETANAAWIFEAPSGATLQTAWLSGDMLANSGWQSTIYLLGGSGNGSALESCPGAACAGGAKFLSWRSYGAGFANAIIARVRCGRAGGCPNGAISGRINLSASAVTVVDGSPPAISVGGPLAAPGWKSGTLAVAIGASDNVGVKQTRVLIDGVPKAAQSRNCNFGLKIPCPNGTDTLNIPLRSLADGPHTLTAQALDSADNLGSTDKVISVDTTAPVAPQGAAIAGGPRWQAANRWGVAWRNPPQRFAPIAGADYLLCPAAADSSNPSVAAQARKLCVRGSRRRAQLARIDDIAVPGPGMWTIRLWLVDAAGNADADTAATISGLGFDPTPPSELSFAAQNPRDPARVNVTARDAVSGVASGTIELRRLGARAWTPLATSVTRSGLTAFMDDGVLARGRYELRAVAVNGAGLQQGTAARASGARATVRLPVRSGVRLAVPKEVAGRVTRGTLVRGRLTSERKPLRGQTIHIWHRIAMSGATWKKVQPARTDARGRFAYRATAGPASAVRFRFEGTPLIRSAKSVSAVKVPARSTIRAGRRTVVNGEYVTFRGHLHPRWIPDGGTLVELQVYTRRRWRTFAQPRAAAKTGRWSYQYRFETIRGNVSFRFRARVRRQSDYPFSPGHSRTVLVRVRGL